jgi:AraC family transcriptional activator of pyochelin receptor
VTATFRAGELRQVLREHVQNTHPELLGNDHDQIYTYPGWLGNGQIRDIELPNGIYLTFHRYRLHRDVIYLWEPCEQECLEIVFSLSGRALCNATHQFDSRQAYLDPPCYEQGQWRQFAEHDYLAVDIHLDPSLLSTLMGDAVETLPPALAQVLGNHRPAAPDAPVGLTPAMDAALAQILRCPYRGVTRMLYLEAKSLELISLFIDACQDLPALSPVLNQGDRERVHHAQKLLRDQLQDPPSLVGLARQVGLNDRKLKEGFRDIFGTTVFGYLTQQRLEQASVLLAQQMSIAAVSAAVGYASPTAFSGAFRRRFGVSPKAYQMKQRCVA